MEDKRTKSQSYHTFCTHSLLLLATVCERFAAPAIPSLFTYQTTDGRGLRKVMDWLTPYANRSRPWPFNQVTGFNASIYTTIYRMAAAAAPWANMSVVYEQVAYDQPGAASSRDNLLYPGKSHRGNR